MVAGVDYPSATSREYTRSWGLAGIKTVKAWEYGATGAGVRVGVVDTGIDLDQVDLKNNISPLSRDMEIGRPNQIIAAEERHGTRVSGVIAHEFNGSGTVGVAFKSTIISYRADREGTCEEVGTDKGCKLPETNIARGVDAAIADGVRVINLSLGGSTSTGSTLTAALLRATNAGIVIVASAGNDATADPEFPAQLSIDPRFRGLIIAAGSTDTAEALSTFSAKAGVARTNYLVAPGTDIIADCDTTSCWRLSGTSFSAPHISGSLALLFQAFPNLTGTQAVDILYRTARDLGTTGTDDTFGRGIIDLERAFSPLGATTTSSSSGQAVRVDLFDGEAGPAFGDAFMQDGLSTAVLDEYLRPFNVSLGYRLRPQANLGFTAETYASEPQQTAQIGDSLLSFTKRAPASEAWGVRDDRVVAQTPVVRALMPVSGAPWGGKLAISLAQTDAGSATRPYGLAGDAAGGGTQFGLMGLGQFQSFQGLVLSKDALSLHAFNASGGFDRVRGMAATRQSASFVQLAHQSQRLTSVLEMGSLAEHGSFLGSRWSDGSWLGDGQRHDDTRAQSRFVGMQFDFALTDRASLTARVQGARMADISGNKAFAPGAPIYASAASLTYAQELHNGWWRLGLEQPMRVEQGSLRYRLADPYLAWGSAQTWSERSINVVPSGRELRLTASRDWLLGGESETAAWLGVELTHIYQPNHIASANGETLMRVRATTRF
ncbi:MAG: hypothetical protein CFE27_10955 [Alphaproteobacteria bacterium PA1]|nr:MAG: hypothetical protein CFE27_10955 [Alphaproteobacteria bacterium PA1]